MTRQTQVSVDRTPEIGDAIGRYRLIGVVGDGGLSRLYIAEQQGISGAAKTVALRCIRAELARSPAFAASFIDAASIAPRFEHPNVLSIYEMSEIDGRYFFSMEYVCGENIASILTRCNTGAHVPLEIAASIVKHTGNAVQYVHDFRARAAKPIALGHGEVNPANLFVTYHGTVKLIASGLRVHEGGAGAAMSGEYRVDPSSEERVFRAPETIDGKSDARSDVFSLGALLWACLTGRRPAPVVGRGELAAVAPSSVRADVPEALDAIALKAMAADPNDRFGSARELSEALDRHLLRGESRATHKHVRRWLEQSFGAERVALQTRIARGRDVQTALTLLGHPQPDGDSTRPPTPRASTRPRELWSTSHSVFSGLTREAVASPRSAEPAPSSAPQERLSVSAIVLRSSRTPPGIPMTSVSALPEAAEARSREPRSWVLPGLLAVVAVAAIGGVVVLSSSDESSPVQSAPRGTTISSSGDVEVRSNPPGAAVFVDGEPAGVRTPVVLKGLSAGRSLRLRVDKAGFVSQERVIEIGGGSVTTQSFELFASDGLVQFVGAPENARIYVDDALVSSASGAPVSLSVGRHALRVETGGALIFSGTVDVVAGEQTIRVDDARAAP